MSWLNANESFFMGMAAQDRIDDLRSTIEDASARAEETDETSRELPAARRARPRCGLIGLTVCRAQPEASR
jgi:hypothetical protein